MNLEYHECGNFRYTSEYMDDLMKEGAQIVQQYVHYILILACLIATFFLYNRQLAAIPLLLLSFILFYVAYNKVTNLKNKK